MQDPVQTTPATTTIPDVDINTLGREELDKYQVPEPVEPTTPEPSIKEPPTTPAPDTSGQKPADKTGKEAEPATPEPEIEQYRKQVAGARKSYYQEVERRKAVEKELTELKANSLMKQAELPEYTADELSELKIEDPDAYVAYQLSKQKAESARQQYQDFKSEQEKRQQEEVKEALKTNVYDFAAQITGKEIIDPNVLPKEVQEFLASETFGQIAQYLDETQVKLGRIPTPQDMRAAWLYFNEKQLTAEAQAKAAEQLKQNIEKAKKGGSSFDRVPPDSTGSRLTRFDKMTATEQAKFLETAGKEELAEYEKWTAAKETAGKV